MNGKLITNFIPEEITMCTQSALIGENVRFNTGDEGIQIGKVMDGPHYQPFLRGGPHNKDYFFYHVKITKTPDRMSHRRESILKRVRAEDIII
jgi:hypothetical protein